MMAEERVPAPVVALPHGRVPPHNLDAERSLLGGVLLEPEAFKDLADVVSAADFYRDAHRKVFEAMAALHEDGIVIDRVSLKERLVERGDLEKIGLGSSDGEDFVDQLDAVVPTAANLAYYARIIRDKAVARRLIEAASAVAQLGYEQHGDVGEFIDETRRRFNEVLETAPAKRSALKSHSISLTREGLRATPPLREYMLRDAKNGNGVFVQGKVGLLASPGGSGKTWALNQLAISMATGVSWFGAGGWVPVKPGRVLLILAEEDPAEVERRLHYSARASGAFSDEQLELIARNVTAMGLAGFGVALTQQDFGHAALPETRFAGELREMIRAAAKARHPYTLVVLDPLSRFAGPDVETDNAAATRWVQVVETLTAPELGNPSVLIAHHLKKQGGKGDKNDSESADPIRGASALVSGVRWAARLEQQKRAANSADLLTLRIVKANGVPPQLSPLILCRDQDHEGALRIATPVEISSHEKVSEMLKTSAQLIEDYQQRVLEVVKPGHKYQRNSISTLVGGKRAYVTEAVRQLLIDGELIETREGRKTFVQLRQGEVVPTGSQAREPVASGAKSEVGELVPSLSLPFREEREPGTTSRPSPHDQAVPANEVVPAPGTSSRGPR